MPPINENYQEPQIPQITQVLQTVPIYRKCGVRCQGVFTGKVCVFFASLLTFYFISDNFTVPISQQHT